MNRFLAFVLLWLAAAGCAAGQVSNDPTLALRLRSDKQSYRVGDEISLELWRENTGKKPFAVPREWGWGTGRTDIHVLDEKGKEVLTDFLADELPPPPRPWDFVVLEAHDFIGTRLQETLKHFVKKPGRYQIVVLYTSHLSESYAREALRLPNVPFWSRERGTVTSNRITVNVTE